MAAAPATSLPSTRGVEAWRPAQQKEVKVRIEDSFLFVTEIQDIPTHPATPSARPSGDLRVVAERPDSRRVGLTSYPVARVECVINVAPGEHPPKVGDRVTLAIEWSPR